MKNSVITLGQFIIDRQEEIHDAKGAFSDIFRAIGLAAKIVNRDVRKAGLVDILGEHGSTNVQGEDVKKLDVIANTIFKNHIEQTGEVCAVISEEEDDVYWCKDSHEAKYILCMDPLDGSSNIDVNASIGTIFSLYKRRDMNRDCSLDDILRPGKEIVAAGYVIYGSSTMLVYSSGNGVNGFTLDDSIHEFCLSHPNIKIPETRKIFSVNEGNLHDFDQKIQDYIHKCKQHKLSARYIGSLIADFHRNLLKGGIYMYPATEKAPNGKLRLLYECIPMAFLIENAGGKATDGKQRILDIQPEKLHQRTPLFVGSSKMVDEIGY
ncbi:MAG: class 1 fructose-bisphosphatase [Bacteroidetes bacterium]|nr:class 1 fructose-bisphosphatase [Bacteroidota bacterium]